MKVRLPRCLAVLVLAVSARSAVAAVAVDPLPACYEPSTVYGLCVDEMPVPVTAFSPEYDYACLAADGPCNVTVETLQNNAGMTSVSPLKYGIQPKVAGSTIQFTLDQPRYLILTAGRRKRLVIAVDPIDRRAPKRLDRHAIDVTAVGADPSGATSSTAAIQAAIDQASAAHGGIAFVPEGVYAITNLTLKSDVSLYLAPGAVLRAAGEPAEFRKDFRTDVLPRRDGTSLIATAPGARNVRVFGRGTIDGDGQRFGKDKRLANHLLVPLACSRCAVDGIVLRDSNACGTVLARSDDVSITNVKMFNAMNLAGDAGLAVCECSGVRVVRCLGIAMDDPFAVQTWAGKATELTARWPGDPRPNHDVLLDDCLAWTASSAFKIGPGVGQPQDAIGLLNCVAHDGAHGFSIAHDTGSAAITGVTVDGLDVERCARKNQGQSWASMTIKGAGTISDVTLRNVTVRDKGTTPVDLHGVDANNAIHTVTFENVHMPGTTAPAKTPEQLGIDAKFADGVTVR